MAPGVFFLNNIQKVRFIVTILFIIVLLETGSLHYVVLAVLELTLKTRLALNSQESTCPCLLSAGIKGIHHHI